MLDDVSTFIRECLLKAADFRYQPDAAGDPRSQQHLRDLEVHWMGLATDYEFAYRHSHFMSADRMIGLGRPPPASCAMG